MNKLGWSDFFQQHLGPNENLGNIGRIIAEEKKYWRVLSLQEEEFICSLPGKLRKTYPGAEAPGVGDWLKFSSERMGAKHNEVLLELRLPRFSHLKRKAAGETENEQLLAANINYALLVMSLNQDFNHRRLERYLSICRDGNVEPVVVLTKADLIPSIDPFIKKLADSARNLKVIITRRDQHDSLLPLKNLLDPGHTAVVLGSSGVGKSTLINFLLEDSIQKTAEIRNDDDKGRHTTTSRSLHVLKNGSMVIDTPGLRELKILADQDSLLETFSDIANLSLGCKFANCKHQTEPGCAVKKAVLDKQLTSDRLKHFHSLQDEVDRRIKRQRGY